MFTVSARRKARLSRLAILAACYTALLLSAATAQAAPASSAAQAARASHMLNTAARVSVRADRDLVIAARTLGACLHRTNSHTARCASARGAVQRTGNQFARSERRLAQFARRSARARRASYYWWAQHAPQLTVDGQQLSWNRVARVATYVLERKAPGQAAQYSLVHGTSTKPPPVLGATVGYAARTDVSGSSWSSWRTITYPAPPAAPPPSSPAPTPPSGPAPAPTPPPAPEHTVPQAAPVLSVSGTKLSWNAIPGVSSYVLATRIAHHAEAFTAVNATSTTPPAVPGSTVHYSVRTAVDGSAWSGEVTITYPLATPPPPPPVESPAPVARSSGFQPGVDSNWDPTLGVGASAQLGAKIVRVEFEINTPTSVIEPVIAAYAAKGIRVAPLAGFYGRLPTTAEARGLAKWATTFGPGGTFWAQHGNGQLAIQTIEFGNETSGGYQYGDNAGAPSFQARAKTYALRLKEASEAISASGGDVGLLAVSEDWTGDWMNGMFEAVPNLGSYIAGWISHPYGSGWRTKIEDIIKQAAAHGAPSSLPIDVTEWGISTDNGRCLGEDYGLNPCMTYLQAAETLRKNVAEIRQSLGGRQGLFIIYQVCDQGETGRSNEREAYFGLLQRNRNAKGAYTMAAEEFLAS